MIKLKPLFRLWLPIRFSVRLAAWLPDFAVVGAVLTAFLWAITGCSNPSARERMTATQDLSRARPAAYAADGFTLDFRSPPERPYRAWEFYFKHCTLVSRNPYPDRAENYCTGPY